MNKRPLYYTFGALMDTNPDAFIASCVRGGHARHKAQTEPAYMDMDPREFEQWLKQKGLHDEPGD